MASDQELLIRINGSAKNFIDELDRVNKKTEDLQKGLRTVAKVSTAAFVGLAAAIGGTVARFSSFEKGFTNVQTLLDKSSFSTKTLTEGIEGLKSEVLALGSTSGENFETLNKGLFDIISATGDAENAMGVLESATELAIAGGTDVSVAVDGLTTSIKAFGLETSDANVIAEKFFIAQKGGKTTVAELSSSIGLAASSAAAYGISLDEVLAASSAATLAGIKTNSTFSGLKAVFAGISKPTAEAAAEASRLGISFDSAALRSKGLAGFLDTLTNANGFTQESIEKLFGSQEAQGILFSLTGKQAGDFKNQLAALSDEQSRAAIFADALAVKQATSEKAFKRLAQSADAVAIVFGEAFAPTLNAIADGLAAAAQKISSFDKETIATIATVAKVASGILGLTALLSILALGYLKVKAVLIATNSVFKITTLATKAYNFVLLAGQKAAKIFAIGMRIATGSVRGFAAATGIGLVLVAISLLVTNFKEAKAAALGTFSAMGTAIDVFVKSAGARLGSLAELLVGIFTLDKEKIKSGFAGLKEGLVKDFSEIGEKSGEAFSKAYNESIASDDAAEQQELDGGAEGESSQLLKDKLKKEQEARDEAAKIKAEKEQKQRKLKREADALESEINTENENLLEDEELERLNQKLLTKDEILKENAIKARQTEIKKRNQFAKDEIKFGTDIAKFKQTLNSEEVQGAKSAADQLVVLTNSKNATLKGIGKAAALVQIGIKTAEGAISAYTSLAGIPFVGPALGAAAAGALIAFGGEQAANVLSAQRGGVVPGGQGGARDRIPALLEPGEIVIPRAVAPEFRQAFGNSPESVDNTEGGSSEITLGFTDDAFEIIEQKLLERRSIGVGSF
jgi:TP901 family phage tail tape measure protein